MFTDVGGLSDDMPHLRHFERFLFVKQLIRKDNKLEKQTITHN